jgi:hypothetical protein
MKGSAVWFARRRDVADLSLTGGVRSRRLERRIVTLVLGGGKLTGFNHPWRYINRGSIGRRHTMGSDRRWRPARPYLAFPSLFRLAII